LINGTTTFTQTGPATFSSVFTSEAASGTFYNDGGISNNNGNVNTLTLTFGGNASGTPNSTIIDGNIYGATEGTGTATLTNSTGGTSPGAQQLYLLSSGAAPPPSSLLAGGTLCTCTYTQWGYWGGDVVSNFGQPNRVDLANINFWVAGQPTVTLPTNFTATYNGNMIGSVNNNGSQYVATGNFTNMWTFGETPGTGTGTFTINTFDGKGPIAGTVTLAGSTYTSASGLSGGGLNGQVRGGFFGPNAPETGGSFAIQSSSLPYSAAGVFLGHR
jgi:hypothetical protein